MFPVFVCAGALDRHLIEHAAVTGPRAGRITWTPAGPASDPRRWTRSFWFKRAVIRRGGTVLGAGTRAPDELRFDGEGRISVFAGGAELLRTERRFRDPSGWVHWHEEYDSAAADPRRRRRVWINGAEETAWEADARAQRIAQGAAEPRFLAAGQAHALGSAASGAAPAGIHIAAFAALDGAAPGGPGGVTGKTGPHGRWAPLDVSGLRPGANGFFPDIPAAMRVRSVPVNSAEDGLGTYAALNPLIPGRDAHLSRGAARVDMPKTMSRDFNTPASFADLSGGKWYWEAEVIKTVSQYPNMALWSSAAGARLPGPYSLGSNRRFKGCGYELGARVSAGRVLYEDGPYQYDTSAPWRVRPGAGGRGMMAFDLDAGRVWYGVNGAWLNGGDPAAGLNPSEDRLNVSKYAYTPALMNYESASAAHFGQEGFAWPPPAGFKALHTANLPRPRIEDAGDVFQAVCAPGAEAETALAAARGRWAACAELFKPAGAAGLWRLRLPHDPDHEYVWGDGPGTAPSTRRAPRAALAGGVMTAGYAVRLGRRYGTAAGSVRHTHGAATKVTHNLGCARGVVILFRRSGTGEALLHHPDCAAGSLLAFGRGRAQTAHGGITDVTADSFDAGAVLPSDTYDYLALTEAGGCFAAGRYWGNGQADGPFVWLGLSPSFLCVIADRNAANSAVTDCARSPFNPARRTLALESARAEDAAGGGTDILANGFKARTSGAPGNYPGAEHFAFAFGQPFAAGALSR